MRSKRLSLLKGVLADEFLRVCRREKRADDKGDFISRQCRLHRIETNLYPDPHPDCGPALALLEAGCKEAMEDAIDAGVGHEHEPGDDEAGVVDDGESQKERISGFHFKP